MSKTDTVNKWLALAQIIAPVMLIAVPHGEKIAPFVPVITAGIQDAEQIPGASAAEKKGHVVGLAMAAYQALQQSGKLHLDLATFQSTVGAGVDATVGAINLVHALHVPASVLLPPVASAAQLGVAHGSVGE